MAALTASIIQSFKILVKVFGIAIRVFGRGGCLRTCLPETPRYGVEYMKLPRYTLPSHPLIGHCGTSVLGRHTLEGDDTLH